MPGAHYGTWAQNLLRTKDMTARTCRKAVLVLLMASAVPGFAQTSPEPPAAGIGKGSAADGSGPADGAIKGGSIVPGESGGVPTDGAASRCGDLTGTLREQCLAHERDASTGGTRLPEADVAKPPPLREAPPPQNPQPRN